MTNDVSDVVCFLDSSAAAKSYVDENGSGWVRTLFRPELQNVLFVARVTPIEVASALFRRVRTGSLLAEDARRGVARLRDHLSRAYQIVDLTDQLAELAILVAQRHALRGYDCV